MPGMKDYRHASRLYIDDNYKLMPKQKFLFHTVFHLNTDIDFKGFSSHEKYELNTLVKTVDLPKYNMNVEEKIQYNKKMYMATRIQYSPIRITFHDDHADTVNAFWKKYYEYTIADSVNLPEDAFHESVTKDDYYQDERIITKWGMDTPKQRNLPYLRSIEIFVLHKKRFTSFTLVNPVISNFGHDNLDQAQGTGILENTMEIVYETVLYKAGRISKNNVLGFATIHYDHEPSPLSVLGKGTASIFGPGGVVDGIGSVMEMARGGNYLGAILGSINTYQTAKKIKGKDAVKQELKGIVKEGVLKVGNVAGTLTNPVSNFAVGSAIATGVAVAATQAFITKNDKAVNNKIITNPTQDTVNFLSADEAYILVTSNIDIKNKIAAGVYYKDIGSRTGLTVAESDVEYTASTSSTKTVYQNKAVTDIRKLINEGYIKIARTSQEVSIVTEKANL